MFGPYRLVSLLGEGGFGSVWRAEQREPIVREVALKLIKLGMDSREIISRFEGERQALALMDHPNIAAVLDAGKTPSGRPYFAMELVKGVPLTEYCDAHRLKIRQRLELLLPVCMAVQHAHQKGVLHRDLKPSNILVQEVDGKPVPKVIDFGIAKALQSGGEGAGLTLLQSQGFSIIGTPLYMSPEQAGLAGQDVDSRSDIYSLGVILYELLTGSTPLTKETVKKAAADELLRLIREQDPPSLERCLVKIGSSSMTVAEQRQTEIKKLTAQLRGDLDWIVLKALEKDRERRYSSASALAQDIEHHLRDEPVSAGPPDAAYRLAKLARKHKRPLIAAGLVVASLVFGLSMALWQAKRATQAEHLAQARMVDAEQARDAAQELLNEGIHGLRDKLMAVGRVEIMEDMVKAAQNYYKNLSPELLKNDETQRLLASLALNRAVTALALGHDEEYQQHTSECLSLFSGLLERNPDREELHREACFTLMGLCIFEAEHSNYDELIKTVDQVVTRCQTWLATHPNTLWAMHYQAVTQMMASFTLLRELKQPAAAFLRIEDASKLTLRMRQVHGDKQEVFECEGLMQAGRARMAEKLGQHTLARMGHESAMKSFEKAIELGGSSVFLREALYSTAHRLAGILQKEAEKNKNEADLNRSLGLFRSAMEGRAHLAQLEPGHAEWWRQLGYSHKALAETLEKRGDLTGAEQHRMELMRCRDEAIRLRRDRPLLFLERATERFGQAKRYLARSGADAASGARGFLSALEDVKTAVEMAGGRLVMEDFQLKNSMHDLGKLALNEGQQGLEWVENARALLQPITKVPEADFEAALAFLDQTKLDILNKLGRDKEAEATRMELAKLSGGSLSPASMHDRARAGLEAASPAIGKIGNLPTEERPAVKTKFSEAMVAVDKLLTAALAAEPENPAFRETQAIRWRLAGQIERALGAKNEALECFDKALASLPTDVVRMERFSILDNQYSLLGELRQFERRLATAQAMVKACTLLTEQPERKDSADDQHRLGVAWQKVAEALMNLGRHAETEDPFSQAVSAGERSMALQPSNRRYQWEWLKERVMLSTAYLHGKNIEKATKAAFPVHQKLLSVLENEPPPATLPRDLLDSKLAEWADSMRNQGFRTEAVQAYRLIANFREKLEQLDAPPTTIDKNHLSTLISLAARLHEDNRRTEAMTQLEEIRAGLPAATPEVQVDVRNRLRGFLSQIGAKAEAEGEALAAYQLDLTIPRSERHLPLAGEWVAIMASNGRPFEALEEARRVWDKSLQDKWPNDPSGRSFALFTLRTLDVLHFCHLSDPKHGWADETQAWLRRFIAAVPIQPGPMEPPNEVVQCWGMWITCRMESRQGASEWPKLCQTLVSCLKGGYYWPLIHAAPCLMLPEAAPAHAEGIAMTERAWKSQPQDSSIRTIRALASIQAGKPQEALTVLQPMEATGDNALWLITHSLMALAFQKSGETAKANAKLEALSHLPESRATYLQSPSNRFCVLARLLISKATAAQAP
jgi:tetratricopeptide (TPR) repeat protein